MTEIDPLKALRQFQDAVRGVERMMKPLRMIDASRDLKSVFGVSEKFANAVSQLSRDTSPLVKGMLGDAARLNAALSKSIIGRDLQRLRAALDIPLSGTRLGNDIARLREALAPIRNWHEILSQSGGFGRLQGQALTNLKVDLTIWEKIGSTPGLDVLAYNAVGWAASVQSVCEDVTSQQWPIAEQMLRPTTILSRLGARTASRLETEEDPFVRQRLEASVEVVQAQVTGHLAHLNQVVADNDISGDQDFAPDARIALATREQSEMLSAPASAGVMPLDLAQAAAGAHIHELARRALSAIYEINLAANVAGRDAVFKLTTRLLQVFVELPWMDVPGEHALGAYVDHLYFLLYEGAGKDKLRYLAAHGGPLEEQACEIIFQIKFLRNKWLRHDPEHGDAGGVRRSYRQLRECLQKFGFHSIPSSRRDYRRLQRRILVDVVAFLDGLRVAVAQDDAHF